MLRDTDVGLPSCSVLSALFTVVFAVFNSYHSKNSLIFLGQLLGETKYLAYRDPIVGVNGVLIMWVGAGATS
jgi:hypothetical protein